MPLVRGRCGRSPVSAEIRCHVSARRKGHPLGTWGAGAFDNDSVCDWLYTLEDISPEERAEVLRETLQTAVASEEYLDYDDAAATIGAAATVVAAQKGQPCSPGGISLGVADLPKVSGELIDLAVQALDRVTGDDSEWRDLWGEGDGLDEALRVVAEIRSELSA